VHDSRGSGEASGSAPGRNQGICAKITTLLPP
jgi:hypothetical protein